MAEVQPYEEGVELEAASKE